MESRDAIRLSGVSRNQFKRWTQTGLISTNARNGKGTRYDMPFVTVVQLIILKSVAGILSEPGMRILLASVSEGWHSEHVVLNLDAATISVPLRAIKGRLHRAMEIDRAGGVIAELTDDLVGPAVN